MNRVRLFFTLLLLFVSTAKLYPQQHVVDSLLQLIENVDANEKAAIYNKLAVIDSKNKPQKRIDYGNIALEIALKLSLKEQEFHAYVQIATGNAYKGNNQNALEYDLKALAIAEELKNEKFLALILANLGYDYLYLSNYEKALECNLKSLEIRSRLFEKGELDNKRILASSYNNVGTNYSYLKQYDKSLEYQKKALELRKSLSDSVGISRSLHNLGVVNEKLDNLNKALKYYKEALMIRRRLNHKGLIAETVNNLGNIYKSQNDFSNAFDCYFEALHLYNELNDKNIGATVVNNIANLYIEQGNPDEAYNYLVRAIELAIETGQKKTLSEAYANLADYYLEKNDYRNAFMAQEKVLKLNDSLFSEDLTDKISEMQTRFETEKKEKEIELLKKDSEINQLKIKKQTTRLYLLSALVIFIFIVGLLLFNRLKLKQKNISTELEKKNLETEQRLLRSQMNPHFIFNSMNSIQGYISGNDSFTAMTYLSKFAQLMRNILENSRKSLITLSDEINTLEIYTELERIRFNKKFDFIINVDPEIFTETVYVPPMLIQPFVENSIKHGLWHKNSNGLLEIKFAKNHNLITCIVRDNGIGRKMAESLKNEKINKHRSLGMQVTQERLSALNQGENIGFKFEISDLEDEKGESKGTQVMITLPFIVD